MRPPYPTLFTRLVANTAEPESVNGCWIWSGQLRHGYPAMTVRKPGVPHPVKVLAHRAMLEEMLGVEFPFDEAGHLCYDTRCVNPDHLEIQTPAFNKSERRGYSATEGRMIPVLFPRADPLDDAACAAWAAPFEPCDPSIIPF